MQISDIKDVLTMAAFRPDSDNPNFTWSQRFQKRKSVIVNISKGQCTWAYLDKSGNITEINGAEGEFTQVANDFSGMWQNATDDGWVGISINNRFMFTLEHNLSRKKGWEDEMQKNPKAILGSKFDKTKRYALHHNPESSASLMLACDDGLVKSIEEILRTNNLKPARICTGLYAMTTSLLTRIGNDEALKNENVLAITWNEGSLSVLKVKKGQWQELRCRSGLAVDDENSIASLLRPFLESIDAKTRIVFMGEKQGCAFSQTYLPQLGNYNVANVTEDNQLWSLITKG